MIYEVKKPIKYLTKWVVEIYMNGHLWDHKEFDSETDANDFYSDPLKEDRMREVKATERREKEEAEAIKYRAFSLERISTGRRIGRKPGAA